MKDGDPDDDSDDDADDAKDKGKDKKDAKGAAGDQDIKASADDGKGKDDGKEFAANAKELQAAALADMRKQNRAERKRVAAIDAILTEHKPRIEAKKFAEIEAKAIEEGLSVNDVELLVLRASRPGGGAVNQDGKPFQAFGINTGSGSPELTVALSPPRVHCRSESPRNLRWMGWNDQQKQMAVDRRSEME